jgi:hypothetical protein
MQLGGQRRSLTGKAAAIWFLTCGAMLWTRLGREEITLVS